MGRYIALFIVISIFLIDIIAANHLAGFSSRCINGQCVMSARNSLTALIIAVVMLVFILVYPRKAGDEVSGVVAVSHRVGAGFIDCLIAMMIMAPLTVLPMLLFEASHSGEFAWEFERSFSRPGDLIVSMLCMMGLIAGFFAYFYLHYCLGRSTIGHYIFGYKIISTKIQGRPDYAVKIVLMFMGACLWPLSLIMASKSANKRFWWDRLSNTRAIKVEYSE